MEYNFAAYSGSSVLVTGASGFTGGHLARKLLDLGANVTLLARSDANQQIQEFVKRGAKLICGDVRDRSTVFKAVEGQDVVFHVAALFREAKHSDQVYFDVNYTGSLNIFDAAEQAGSVRVVHCSTNGVHGTIDNPPGNEDSPFKPGDVYQESKLKTEMEIAKRVQSRNSDIVIIRPAMIWGEADTRFRKMFKAISRRRFPIIGTGQTLCHWLYVHDLVDGFLLAGIVPEARGRTYLLAGAEIVTLEQTVNAIAHCAGVKPLPLKIPARPIQILGTLVEAICVPLGIEPPLHRRRVDFFVKNRAFDISRARNELGFRPQFEFQEEVRRIFNWYKQAGWLQ